MKFIKLQLPIVDFIKNYDKQQVLYDLKAGIMLMAMPCIQFLSALLHDFACALVPLSDAEHK